RAPAATARRRVVRAVALAHADRAARAGRGRRTAGPVLLPGLGVPGGGAARAAAARRDRLERDRPAAVGPGVGGDARRPAPRPAAELGGRRPLDVVPRRSWTFCVAMA